MLFREMRRGISAGLAVAVIIVGAGCATSHRTPEQREADREIAARVASALNSDSHIYARHIDVRAENGVVHLSGYVWSDEDLDRAKEIAATVPGVSTVVDNMELQRGGMQNSPVSR